jgi:DNA gyrase subunit A
MTIKLTESKGALGGALVVRDHQELVFISQEGMVQRTAVRGISQQGRAATGVRVMNIRDEDKVSAVALVVESEAQTAAQVLEDNGAAPTADEPTGATEEPTPPTDGAAPDSE